MLKSVQTTVSTFFYVTLLASFLLSNLLSGRSQAQDFNAAVASQAVVQFSFEEDAGVVRDHSRAGKVADVGKVFNNPARIPSPFWNQTGKYSLQLDAAKQQSFEVPGSSDIDAAKGITIGMFCVSLTELTDSSFHGLFAKRGVKNGKLNANYGINFQTLSDQFQVYLHDGGEFRVATYRTKEALPYRKRVYVTATFTVGDAPGQDSDTDQDDVRIQYFINGEPLIPKGSTRGFVHGSEAWTLDVNLPGLLNDFPLTIGKSESDIEYTSCIIGDFRVFPRALSEDEVKRLFLEVVSNIDELMAAEKPLPVKEPMINGLSRPGLQVGQTTQLIVTGSDLGPNTTPVFPLPEVHFEVVEGSTANRLILNVTVPSGTVPGIYPMWVKSHVGISRSVAIAIDRLPQIDIGGSSDQAPQLPAAFFGNLSGGQQRVVTIAGKKGDRLVADVEMKRLGGAANPVIEIKSSSGTPLAISWGQNSLRGDARVELFLPEDGLFSIELHDLTFNAPGSNPFRLKIGDLKLIDGLLPSSALPGAVEVELIGSGFAAGTKTSGQFLLPNESSSGSIFLPPDVGFAGVLPPVALSRGIEFVESPHSSDAHPQIINIGFSPSLKLPVAISGRITTKGEKDSYVLNVVGGHKLKFTLQADSLGSSLEGEIQILGYPQGNLLSMTGDQPANGDPSLEFDAPAGTSQVRVQVRDLFGRGDTRAFYRLVIEPADQPKFALTVNAPVVNMPEDGSAIVEVQVSRMGYTGPITLNIVGDEAVSVSPQEIGPNIQGKLWLRLDRSGKSKSTPATFLRLVGQTVGVDPVFRRAARIQSGGATTTFTDILGVGTTAPSGFSLELQQHPTVLFRGVTTELGLILNRQPDHVASKLPVRLSLDSTETVRKRDPNNPAAGTYPMVAAIPKFLLSNDPQQSSIKVSVPLEVSETALDFAIKAELLSHEFSERVLSRAFSRPFHAEIKNAVSPKVDQVSLSVIGEAEHKVTGIVQRTSGFFGPVEIALLGLPEGYVASSVVLGPDQDKFELIVRAPKVSAEMLVPNIKLRLTSAGSLLVPDLAIDLKVVPGI